MSDTLGRLRALAEAATPGPWTWDDEVRPDEPSEHWAYYLTEIDREFIITCRGAVLALLDVARAAKDVIHDEAGMLPYCDDPEDGCGEQWVEDIKALRAALARLDEMEGS